MILPRFCALLVLIPSMIKAGEDTRMGISFKYRWNEGDAHHSSKVNINWDRTGTCDHRVFGSNRDSCNPAVPKLEPFNQPNQTCEDSIDQVVDHLYNKSKKGKCTAKRNLKFKINNKNKDKFFLIEIDNICCDHRCKITDLPTITCYNGPPGQVIEFNGQYIDGCKNES